VGEREPRDWYSDGVFWGWGLDCAVDGCPGEKEIATSKEEG
jgi:hypothetical protein